MILYMIERPIARVFPRPAYQIVSGAGSFARRRRLLVLTSPARVKYNMDYQFRKKFTRKTHRKERKTLAKRKRQPAALFSVYASYGLLLFLCAYPFFLQDRYFKMTLGKTVFFYCVTAAFALGCMLLGAMEWRRAAARLARFSPTDLFLSLFLFTAILSCAASQYREDAFSGEAGRYMGLLTLLVIGCAYFFVSRFGSLTPTVAVIFGVSMIAMNTVSLLQFRGYDPFGLYQNTQATVRINFMSLVGNKDVYYSYLALTVPFAMYLTHEAAEIREKIFWHTAAFFGFAGAFACNSEGVFIALLPAFLILFFARCGDKPGLLCFLRSVMTFFGAALLTALIKPDLSQFGIQESLVMRLLVRPIPSLCALAVCGALYALLLQVNLPPKRMKTLRVAVACLLCAAAAGLIGAFVYFTFFDKTTDVGGLSEFLRFDSHLWGNKRGYVWSRLLRLFKDFPLFRMLIGTGEETVEKLMQSSFGTEMIEKTGMNFDNAHNEFLQYLITQGVLGLLTYVLFAGSAVKSGFREGGPLRRAAVLCCVCYLAQSFVNISQAITTPLFFVFLALTQTADAPDAGVPSVGTAPRKQPSKR